MYKISKRKLAIILMVVLSFVVAVWQPFGYSPDFTSYESFFQEIRSYFGGLPYSSRFEPGFFYISIGLTQFFTSDLIVYGMFVVASVSLKLSYGLRETVESYFWIAIVFYIFKYFPLHELTQLRAALAAAFLIPAFSYIERKSYWKGLFACLIAALFHYSALIISPFLFLPRFDRRQIVVLAIVIFVILFTFASYFIGVASENFQVFEMYGDYGDRLHPLNIFSPVFFPEFFIILFSLVFWKRLSETMRRVVAVEIFGFSLFYAFSDYGVVAVRGRELFSIFWLFFVGEGAVSDSKIRLGINIFVASSIAISVYLFFISDFFTQPF